jgi:hypothetical protein
MALLDLFRSEPKACTSCGRPSAGLHRVWSGLRRGEVTDRLCTECLGARLRSAIEGLSILFIEPMVTDGYTFLPLDDEDCRGLLKERVNLALTSLAPACATCSGKARHLWMPRSDLDEAEMARQSASDIPAIPSAWKGTVSLCPEHAVKTLRDYSEHKRYFFRTFRFPSGGDTGYYS